MGSCLSSSDKNNFSPKKHIDAADLDVVSELKLEKTFYSSTDNVTSTSSSIDSYVTDDTIHKIHVKDFNALFKIKRILGKGSFATVHLAVSKQTKKKYAVKILDKIHDPNEVAFFREECKIMAACRAHPNVCSIKRLYETNQHIYMVMDYAAGGNLLDMALKGGTRTEIETAYIVRDIADALSHIHRNGISHRDMKLENILITKEGTCYPVKLADFGLAKAFEYIDNEDGGKLKKRILRSACGSPLYVAPEIILRKPYTTSIDIWGLGVICFSLIAGMSPFYKNGMTNKDLYRRILRGQFLFNGVPWKYISRECKKFICELLEVNPKLRLTADEILTHPWLINTIQSDIEKKNSGNPEEKKLVIQNVKTPVWVGRRLSSDIVELYPSHSENLLIHMEDFDSNSSAATIQPKHAETPHALAYRRLSAI